MKTIYHNAQTRGHANHGWLDTYHTFSFANYHNPERVHFGALRVLNDDTVAGGRGFGMHPHRDMEIISIPLSGALQHEDSMGNKGIIQKGEVQVMTAGSGIMHSEMNANSDEEVKFLQIWLFPKSQGLEPRYDQVRIDENPVKNDFQQIVSPNENEVGAWIHQDAWFHMADFDAGSKNTYSLKKEGNGVYVFVLEGEVKIGDKLLSKRDGLGIVDTEAFDVEATEDAEFLLMEVPMAF